MAEPTIVLVHGFWGGAAHWEQVILELHRRGHTDLHAVENPLTALADDAARTQQMIRQVDGPVLLVGHSYGGAVITEAGNLPNVVNMDIHHAESAILTPSDMPFARDGIAAEITPNSEGMAIADLSLAALVRARTGGAVRNLADRRTDLYRVAWQD